MKSSRNTEEFIVDKLIDFFYSLSGNRSMPNLFPNVFDYEKLREYKNKSKQLTYLFKIFREKDAVDDLLNILVGNLTWNDQLEENLNKLIKPLNLICLNGEILKISKTIRELKYGEFNEIYKEVQKNPDNKKQILKKSNISEEEFNSAEKALIEQSIKLGKYLRSVSSVLDIGRFMETVLKPLESVNLLENILRSTEIPPLISRTPIVYPLVEEKERKVIIYQLCPITRGNCALADADNKELESKKPYAFLIFPSEYKYLEKIAKELLNDYNITLITAIAEPFIGGKYCKICSLIKFCNFCIAELGSLNLNVFMEIGLAYGLDKFTILTLNENHTKQEKIPFDLDSFMNIPYKDNDELAKGLRKHIEKVMLYIGLDSKV